MWPHLRINTRNLAILCFGLCILYLLHSISTPAQLRRIPIVSSISMANLPEEVDPFQVNMKQLLIACIQAVESAGQKVYHIRKSKVNQLDIRAKKGVKGEDSSLVTEGDLASHRVIVHGLSATFTGLQVISEENHHEDAIENDEEEIIKPFHINHDPKLFEEDISSLPPDLHSPLKQLTVWVDPLDATQEYTESLNDESLLNYVTVMVCIAINSRPIIGIIHKPFEHKTYWAWEGIGMSNSLRELFLHSTNSSEFPSKIIISRSHAGSVEKFIKSKLGSNVQVTQAGGAGYKILQVVSGASNAYIHNSIIKKWDICAPNAIIESLNGKMTTLNGDSISYSAEDNIVNSGGILAAFDSIHSTLLNKLKS